jgi:hypothetical protein
MEPTAANAPGASSIAIENLQPGTDEWTLKGDPVSDDIHDQIKGFADHVSVNRGGEIGFKVTVNPAQAFTMAVYRIGWYQGLGGRLMATAGPLPGVTQPACPPTGPTLLIACNWSTSYSLVVPTSWVSGEYLVKLRNAAGYVNYISFTVRDDASHTPLLFQSSVNTWEAYNDWGGTSLYSIGSNRAREVSFDRPYSNDGTRLVSWEIQMVRYLERNGFDVSYTTDVDTDANPPLLLQHRALLVVGHDEYWTWDMRDAVEHARNEGVDVGFFGGNDSYWQIRYDSSASGVPRRIIVGYKEDYTADPWYTSSSPLKRRETTGLWRSAVVNRPEQLMTGEMYAGNTGSESRDASLDVVATNSWIATGTSPEGDASVPRLVGHEFDAISRSYPFPQATSREVIGRSLVDGTSAETSMYVAPSGAIVFDAGTTSWDWGLDGFGDHHRVSPVVQEITLNLLDRFVAGS